MTTYVGLWYFLMELFLEREIFQKGVVEKSRTHILSFNICMYVYIYRK